GASRPTDAAAARAGWRRARWRGSEEREPFRGSTPGNDGANRAIRVCSPPTVTPERQRGGPLRDLPLGWTVVPIPLGGDAQRDGAFARPAAEQAMKVVHAAGRLSVRGDDDVAHGHARLGRGAAALDAHHLDARLLREPEPPRRAACERAVLAGDAEVAAAHVASGHELPEHPLRGVDRDAEAQALRAEDHGSVDADHQPAAVDQPPARVARVDRYVALDDALHQAP